MHSPFSSSFTHHFFNYINVSGVNPRFWASSPTYRISHRRCCHPLALNYIQVSIKNGKKWSCIHHIPVCAPGTRDSSYLLPQTKFHLAAAATHLCFYRSSGHAKHGKKSSCIYHFPVRSLTIFSIISMCPAWTRDSGHLLPHTKFCPAAAATRLR